MTDHIIKAAKEAGGTTYTNRHFPGEIACAFGPEALARFYSIARAEALEDAAKVCDEQQDVPATEPRHCAMDIRLLKEQQHG